MFLVWLLVVVCFCFCFFAGPTGPTGAAGATGAIGALRSLRALGALGFSFLLLQPFLALSCPFLLFLPFLAFTDAPALRAPPLTQRGTFLFLGIFFNTRDKNAPQAPQFSIFNFQFSIPKQTPPLLRSTPSNSEGDNSQFSILNSQFLSLAVDHSQNLLGIALAQ